MWKFINEQKKEAENEEKAADEEFEPIDQKILF
jgi:hypothetical protein